MLRTPSWRALLLNFIQDEVEPFASDLSSRRTWLLVPNDDWTLSFAMCTSLRPPQLLNLVLPESPTTSRVLRDSGICFVRRLLCGLPQRVWRRSPLGKGLLMLSQWERERVSCLIFQAASMRGPDPVYWWAVPLRNV